MSITPTSINTDVNLRPWTRRKIDECPTAGSGLNRGLSTVAVSLRHETDEDPGIELLFNLAVERGRSERKARIEAERLRRKWRDLSDAPAPAIGTCRERPKPKAAAPDKDLISRAVSGSTLTVAQLTEMSPIKVDPADDSAAENIVDLLFPDRDIICASVKHWDAHCEPHGEAGLSGLNRAQFLCPNPMREAGHYKQGKPSPRRNLNVLYRRWLVIEFDIARYGRDGVTPTFWKPTLDQWEQQGIGAQDAQARLIQRIAGYEFNLAMVVFSGGKSLHSWWPVAGKPEGEVTTFIDRAVKLGADPAAKIPSQFFRMPHGKRQNGERQRVVYLDLEILTSNTRKK